MKTVKIIGGDGLQVKVETSILLRMKGAKTFIYQRLNRQIPAAIYLKHVKSKMFSKVCAWLHHYKSTENPIAVNEFSEWDHKLLQTLNSKELLELILTADLVEAPGMADYVIRYLTSKFGVTPQHGWTKWTPDFALEGNPIVDSFHKELFGTESPMYGI